MGCGSSDAGEGMVASTRAPDEASRLPARVASVDLVRGVLAGDAVKLELLIEQLRSQLATDIGRMVRDDSDTEDLTQEALVKIIAGLIHLRDPSALSAWTRRIAVNLAKDHRRKRRLREVPLDENTAQAVLPGWDGSADALEGQDALARGMATLSDAQRAVLELHYLQDLSYSEIAQQLGIPSATVNSRLHRGLASLRAWFRSRPGKDGNG